MVLEFWATWCSPCVASLPHFNQLVESLPPEKFQFISIDDEDQKAVEKFLSIKKMSGWVGLDAPGRVFAGYGITSRPTTVIVDGNGKVVAVTDIDSVSETDLQAVAAGKTVAFKPVMEITDASAPSIPDSTSRPLFSVSVSQAAPDARLSLVNHAPTGTDLLGADADSLLTQVFDPFENRCVLKDSLPDGRFDLRVNFVDVPPDAMRSAMQQAVLATLHLQAQSKTVTRPAYVLRATDASSKLLSPSASTRHVKRGYWHGSIVLMNGAMDDLAYLLATSLENPVINETGIAGTYDARFKIPEGDLAGVNAVLKQTMGLELVPGDKEMSITVTEVSQREEAKKSSAGQPQDTKH